MLQTNNFDPSNPSTSKQYNNIANFLFDQLDQYGDPIDSIKKCLDFALDPKRGGDIITLEEDGEILAATILNKTGMKGYIPENILVYIATHRDHRGKGLGRSLMEKAISTVEGDIALHVEKDNPAKFLYEKLGFTNPYLEMRLKRG